MKYMRTRYSMWQRYDSYYDSRDSTQFSNYDELQTMKLQWTPITTQYWTPDYDTVLNSRLRHSIDYDYDWIPRWMKWFLDTIWILMMVLKSESLLLPLYLWVIVWEYVCVCMNRFTMYIDAYINRFTIYYIVNLSYII